MASDGVEAKKAVTIRGEFTATVARQWQDEYHNLGNLSVLSFCPNPNVGKLPITHFQGVLSTVCVSFKEQLLLNLSLNNHLSFEGVDEICLFSLLKLSAGIILADAHHRKGPYIETLIRKKVQSHE